MNTFALKVEPFAGSDVKDVSVDLCRLANTIGVLCEAQFNGVTLWARPDDDPQKLAEEYFKELQRPGKFKLAQATVA